MQNENIKNIDTDDTYFLLSHFSHEIRNPISLISSELQLLAASHPEITTYDCWNDILDNLEYTKELLAQFSDYNNARKLLQQDIYLSTYLCSMLSKLKPTLKYLGITLETEIADNLSPCLADPVKLRQALLNLLKNAVEAVDTPGGKIIFTAKQESKGVLITITDNGCGIPPDKLDAVFTPFVTFKPNGTGLGLAITKQIIQAHGGKLTVNSTLHQGTSFQIFLNSRRPG